jgi:hypothetical protein
MMPIDAESRGRRRVWKTMASARFSRMLKAFDSSEVARAAKDFVKLNGRHVAAGLVLERAFAPPIAWLEARESGRRPVLMWGAISAQAESPFRSTPERDLTADEQQGATACHYILTARTGFLLRGLWGTSVSDHALGRLCQRSPGVDIDAAIMGLNRAILSAPERMAPQMVQRAAFAVPVLGGVGGFWCSAYVMRSVESGLNVLHVRARTWLDAGLIEAGQLEQAQLLLYAEDGDTRLASSLLHPLHLRRRVDSSAA